MISAAPTTATSDSTAASDGWFTRSKLFLLLGAFVVMAFPTVVIGTNSFFYRDMGQFGYPLAQFHREAFWRGELPLWNPLNNMGLPFLAQWNTLVLYPGSLIYLLLPLLWSMNLFMFAHLFLAAAGMYALAKRWTNSGFAASVAGLAFAWNGLTLHALMWPNNMAALGWMPWVVLALERAWREGGRRVFIAALAGAMQMLTGAPEIILLTWLIVGVLWVRDLFTPGATRSRLILRIAFASALVFGLCAAQLLPFLDLVRHSNRDASFGGAAWSMPLWGWANFFVPMFGCTPSVVGVYSQDAQQWTSSYYLGIGTVLFATLAWRVRDGRAKWLAGIALAGLLLALGDDGFVYAFLKKVLPVLGFIRFPIKYVVLIVFALPLLAAFGAKEFVDDKTVSTRAIPWWLPVAITIILIVVWAYLQPVGGAVPKPILTNGVLRLVFLGGIVALLCMSVTNRWLKPRLACALVIVLLAADVLWHMPSQNPVVPNSAYGPVELKMSSVPKPGESRAMISPPMEQALSGLAHPDPLTMFTGHRRMLLADCNLLSGVPKVDGFYSLYLRDAEQVTRRLYRSTNYNLPLLDFIGVSQISDDAALFEWHARSNAMPLVTAGQAPLFADAAQSLDTIFATTFAPRRTVVLPTNSKLVAGEVMGGRCEVLSSNITAQSISLLVNAEAPALVVIAQAHTSAWRARIGERDLPVLKANHAFQAIVVPPGRHLLHLRYQDDSFRGGVVLSATSLLACGVGLLWFRRSSRR